MWRRLSRLRKRLLKLMKSSFHECIGVLDKIMSYVDAKLMGSDRLGKLIRAPLTLDHASACRLYSSVPRVLHRMMFVGRWTLELAIY